jgi:hypothetical protein
VLEQVNPFAALTVIVAPAILTNASSVLALGTGNRLGRVVDRTRILAREAAAAPPAERERVLQQIKTLQARAQMLVRALRFFYVALGLFASSAFISVVGSIAATFEMGWLFKATAVLGVTAGSLAVVALVSGCAVVARETRYAVQTLEDEARL